MSQTMSTTWYNGSKCKSFASKNFSKVQDKSHQLTYFRFQSHLSTYLSTCSIRSLVSDKRLYLLFKEKPYTSLRALLDWLSAQLRWLCRCINLHISLLTSTHLQLCYQVSNKYILLDSLSHSLQTTTRYTCMSTGELITV